MNNYYYQLEVFFENNEFITYTDLIIKSRHDFNCDGIEEFSMDENEVDEILGERAYSGGNLPADVLSEIDDHFDKRKIKRVLFLFCNQDASKNADNFSLFLDEKKIKFIRSEKNTKDWNSEWREHYTEIKISKSLVIVPSWKKDMNKENEVYIYPGMGFGTGGHETTYLCLKHFEDFLEEGKKFNTCLDFGCGSGILGISAKKRGDVNVDFCDIDTDALDNCHQNLLLNFAGEDLQGNTLVSRERYKNNEKYDLIFANILENILIEEKEVVLNSLSEGGHLIVSGILTDQIETIKKEYSNLKVLKTYEKGDWASIAFSMK